MSIVLYVCFSSQVRRNGVPRPAGVFSYDPTHGDEAGDGAQDRDE